MRTILCVNDQDLINNDYSLSKCNIYKINYDNFKKESIYKQIIPHILFLNPDNSKLLMYRDRINPEYSLKIGNILDYSGDFDKLDLFKEMSNIISDELRNKIGYICSHNELSDIKSSLEFDYIPLSIQDPHSFGIATIFIADADKIIHLKENAASLSDTMWLCPKAIRLQGWTLDKWSQEALDWFVPVD